MADQLTDAFVQTVERAEIGGRYTNLHRLGAGAFSVVFQADDLSAKRRRAAVKFLNPIVSLGDPYRAISFQREARIIWDLRGQPDIIECLSAEATFPLRLTLESGQPLLLPVPYYAMELGDCGMDAVIAAGGWEAERMLGAFGAMCRAVQRIHRRGIVHRDLKPDNFVVMPNKGVKLADIGTARRLDEGPISPSYTGWPGDRRHTAPEMFALLHDDDPSIAVRADIFSLGTILFELLTGTKLGLHIFDTAYGDDLADVMHQVRAGERQRLFERLLPSIVEGHPLPLIADFGQPLPRAIAGRVEGLYRKLCHLDHRHRLCDFDRIFYELERCLFLVRHENAYLRLQEIRQERQAGRAARVAAVAARRTEP